MTFSVTLPPIVGARCYDAPPVTTAPPAPATDGALTGPGQSGPAVSRDASAREFAGGRERTGPGAPRAAAAEDVPRLAPPIDFRYIGLDPYQPPRGGLVAGSLGFVAAGASVPYFGHLPGAVLLGVAGLSLATCMMQLFRRPREIPERAEPVAMALFPYGVLIDGPEATRALRWLAVDAIHAHSVHGSENGVATTLYSLVVVEVAEGHSEANRKLYAGKTHGGVSVDALAVHLAAYREEQGRGVALSLDPEGGAADPTEPHAEMLVEQATEYLHTADASAELDLSPFDYRGRRDRALPAASEGTFRALRAVLTSRRAEALDRRPLAVALAGLLDLRPLARDVVALVTAPNPLLAALARVVARRLGVDRQTTGTLDEVLPFLDPRDAAFLLTQAT